MKGQVEDIEQDFFVRRFVFEIIDLENLSGLNKMKSTENYSTR